MNLPFHKKDFIDPISYIDQYSKDSSSTSVNGYMFHYIKSNQDNTKRADVWLYYPQEDRSEYLEVNPVLGRSEIISMEYSFSMFQAEKINQIDVKYSGYRSQIATIENIDYYTDQLTYREKQKYKVPFGVIPSFNYNYNWCELITMYRYLLDKNYDFSIGMIAEDIDHSPIAYTGKIDFKYNGIDFVNNRQCRKYIISGEPFEKETGLLYTDYQSKDVVEIYAPKNNTLDYDNFKLVLIDKQAISNTEWDEKKNNLLKEKPTN
jgi:hypothetical protein